MVRKATLASIVAKASPGIRFNEHMEGDGPTVFAHVCAIDAAMKASIERLARKLRWKEAQVHRTALITRGGPKLRPTDTIGPHNSEPSGARYKPTVPYALRKIGRGDD